VTEELLCPVCRYEYVHPVALKVEPVSGDMVLYIDSQGLHTFPSTAAEQIRGIRITTTFVCEEGHQWDEERAFCKGKTYQKLHRGPDYLTSENFAGAGATELMPSTIWRD
jgi:hypothetical protein